MNHIDESREVNAERKRLLTELEEHERDMERFAGSAWCRDEGRAKRSELKIKLSRMSMRNC